MRRRGWKRGDWLIKDEESGLTEYASNVGRDYYGVLKRKNQMDDRHPQEAVYAKNDPFPVFPITPPLREYDLATTLIGNTVGLSNVPVVDSPASHLYRQGIGKMEIGLDFQVY